MPEAESGQSVVQREVAADRNTLAAVGKTVRDVVGREVKGTRDNLRSVGEATRYAGKYYRSKLSKRSAGR
jgi:hypothetical protein